MTFCKSAAGILPVLCALLLSACANLKDAPLYIPAEEDEPVRIKIALALTLRPGENQPAQRVRMTWERTFYGRHTQDVVDIKDPLGNTRARVSISPDDVSVEIAGGGSDERTQQILNIMPPPQSLGYWLLGAPDPDYSSREIISVQHPGAAIIVQHGWKITYEQRDEKGRPKKIILQSVPPEAAVSDAFIVPAPSTKYAPPPGAEATVEITRWLIPS